jgi:hypothetical protein
MGAMRRIMIAMLGFVIWLSGGFIWPDEADARKNYRMNSSRSSGFIKPRMKTYYLHQKPIYGYRAFIRERRAAKLASGGFMQRRDGSVVPRNFRPQLSGFRTIPFPLPAAPNKAASGKQGGQCRDGAMIDSANLDWDCRHLGGIGWSHQPARIQGIRTY